MKKTSGKIRLFITLAISLFGVMVGCVASFAWFQASFTNRQVTNGGGGTADTTGTLTVNDVKGYKYTYDDYGGSTGPSGSVIGESSHGNIDADETSTLDVPSEGVGFYILGDETWAVSQEKAASTAWKYSSSLKMTDRYSDDYAKERLTLSANEHIKFIHHTYEIPSGKEIAQTTNTEITTINSASASKAVYDSSNNPNSVKILVTGTYDIFINRNKEICFNAVAEPAGKVKPKELGGPTKKSLYSPSQSSSLVILDVSGLSWWKNNDATAACYLFGGSGDAVWTSAQSLATNRATFVLPEGDWTKIIFARLDPEVIPEGSTPTAFKDQAWNQTVDLNLYRGGLFKITGESDGKSTGSWYAPNGYYMVGVDGSNQFFYNTGLSDSDAWTFKYARFMGESTTSESDVTIPSGVRFKLVHLKNDKALTDGNCTFIDPTDSQFYGLGECNDTTAITGYSANSGNDIVTSREILCDLAINGSVVDITIHQFTITYYYDVYGPDGTTQVSTDNNYGETTSVFYGTTLAASGLVDPAISDFYTGWNANDEKWDCWYKTVDPDTRALSDKYSSEPIIDDLVLYGRCKEKTFDITLKIGQCNPGDWTRDESVAYTTYTLSGVTASTAITESSLNGLFSPSDTATLTWEGYYTAFDSGAKITFNMTISNYSSVFASSGRVIYGLYKPKGITVTYNYQLWTRDAQTGAEALYNGSPSISSDTNTAYLTTKFVQASNQPLKKTYIVSDGSASNPGVYKFIWDNNIYKTDGSLYKDTILLTDTTLVVRLYAEVQQMYVIDRVNINQWFECKIILHVVTTRDVGDEEIELKKNSSDGVFMFKMSTSGIRFYLRNNKGDQAGDRTPDILSLANNDTYGQPRGVYGDAIELQNTSTYSYGGNRDWRWSVYFGGNKSASLEFDDGDSIPLKRGDGAHNMYILDEGLTKAVNSAFVLKLVYDGKVSYFGYDQVDGLSQPFVTEGAVDSTKGDKKKIIFNSEGDYTIYFTAEGVISVASVPKEKGEGYYIMPYDSDGIKGNKNTVSYYNGIKMRRTLNPSAGQNVATYLYFKVEEGDKYYIRSYIDAVDETYKTLGTSYDFVSVDANGILTFSEAGNYDIYIKQDGGVYKLFIAKSADNFYILNRITGTPATIKAANTTLVLEVEFTYTGPSAQMGVNIYRTAGSLGLSNYLCFAVYCNDSALGRDSYTYMRDNLYESTSYFTGSSQTKLGVFDVVAEHRVSTSTPHYLYIMIDYKGLDVASNSAHFYNDFTLSLTARS